eukprot:jgi/Mesen1/5665/ME000287S04924
MGVDKRLKNPVQSAVFWVKKQPPKVKTGLGVLAGILALLFLRMVVVDHDNLFVAAEAIHSLGIGVLIYKLMKEKTCAGPRCAAMWQRHSIQLQLQHMLWQGQSLAPCAIAAILIHPGTSHHLVNRVLWAFCVYLEAVSVLPQLRVMQNTKVVEPFTAHYVFALGIARFLSCAHWLLQILDGDGSILSTLGYGLWPSMVLLSEVVQTFILADFCYYYGRKGRPLVLTPRHLSAVRSVMEGQMMVRLPAGVV